MTETSKVTETLWRAEQYQLIDFGEGRKLERFGSRILDRPCPAAEPHAMSALAKWDAADIVLNENAATEPAAELDRDAGWHATYGDITFNLKITPFGHVGLFPEQVHNWNWLRAELGQRDPQAPPLAALNLFAYTGGTTLALAGLGTKVVHVDASAPAVQWARQNARSSGMENRPIRWITEDARKFAARELRRGNRYDIIVLDPPSYGHGPTGKRWEIGTHLPNLLEDCVALLRRDGNSLLLISAHSEQPSMRDIDEMVRSKTPRALSSGRLSLLDEQHRPLDAGFFVRAAF